MIFLYALASGGVFLERFLNLMLSMKSCFFSKRDFLNIYGDAASLQALANPGGTRRPRNHLRNLFLEKTRKISPKRLKKLYQGTIAYCFLGLMAHVGSS